MASVQHNSHVLAARYARRAQRVEQATRDELDVQAQKVARVMRARVAKFRSEVANSIHVAETGPMEKTIAPGSAHARYVEDGVKPGGKGLPRFFDPASADIVAWLRDKAFAGVKRARKGSSAFQAVELALRDRYEGLAWHIRRHGVKAQPFVEPTAREMAGPVAQALRAATMAALTAGDAGARQ